MKSSNDRQGYRPVRTAFGPVVILWRGTPGAPVVTRIFLPGEWEKRRVDGGGAAIERESCARIEDLASRIGALCAGEAVRLDTNLLDLGSCGEFQRSVLRAEHGIPRGSVSTYGRIARHIGHPGAARAVGSALARNPFPLVIPCHRAVREGGALGGFRGGLAMKRRLLELEGVELTGRGKVAMKRPWYDAAPPKAAGRRRSRRKERA